MRRDGSRDVRRKAILKVGYRCNNNCDFCHSAPHRGVDSTTGELKAKIREAASLGAGLLALSGGEPTIRPDLDTLAAAVEAEGMALGLVTNGRMLAYPGLAERLVAHGLAYAYVSLSGPDAGSHDHAVCCGGAFEQTLQGIRQLAGKIDDLTVNLVVTADNLDRLREFAPLLAGHGAVRCKFSLVEPEGRALDAFERLVPPLGEASRAVADALDAAGRENPGLRLAVDGFPLCHLSGRIELESGLREDGFFIMSEALEPGWFPVDDRNRSFAEVCCDCSLRRRCRGTYTQYLDRRGPGELRPVRCRVPNSFNLEPVGEPEVMQVRSCPVRAGQRPPPDPVRGILLEEEDGRFVRLETHTRDFSDATIKRIIRGLGQVYRDAGGQVLVRDFGSQLRRATLDPGCPPCPRRPLCGGAWKTGGGNTFERARRLLDDILQSLEGEVLDIGCGRAPYLDALEPAITAGRLRYLGLDPAAEAEGRGTAREVVRAGLESFAWRGAPFDAVLCLRSLNHLPSLREGLTRIASLLRDGGTLVLSEDVVFAAVRPADTLEAVRRRRDLPFEHLSNPFPDEVEPLAASVGLDVVRHHTPRQTTSTIWIMVLEKQEK